MNRGWYVVRWKPAYAELLNSQSGGERSAGVSGLETVLVTLSQGGFGEGVADFAAILKERYLEHEFGFRGLDLPLTAETFDRFFLLEEPSEIVDLDE